MNKMNYVGQIFGTREVIRNYCTESDWINIKRKIPKDIEKYRLTKCLVCGALIPTLMNNLTRTPPKHCPFCSGYGQRNIPRNTNHWTVYEDVCIGNIKYKDNIISAYIDPEDYELVSQYTWRVAKKKNKYYLITGSYKDKTAIYLHRLLIDSDVPNGYEVDHIDGNSLNNRRANLRVVSRLENIQNSRVRIDNEIGIRGISKDKGSFIVDFVFSKTRYYFKNWKTLEEAVYCRKYAEEHFGLNILNRNPLSEQYLTLSNKKANEIKNYVEEIISRKRR